jgi:nucleotide-binding universal stress UspA family protein
VYHTALIPLDGSPEAEGVFGLVRDELAPNGEIILLQVIPPVKTQTVGKHTVLASQQEDNELFNALIYLKGVGEQYQYGAATWRCEVSFSSSVTEEIANVAQREGVDLIVMYTHHRRGLARLLRGSVSQKVMQRSPIETRVFRAQELVEAG